MLPVRPTRRGVAVALLALAAAAMAVRFGPRSLDAVALAAAVVLAAAPVQLALVDAPRVERTAPPPGVPGTTGTVSLTVATDTPLTAVVHDRLPDGVEGTARTTALVGDRVDPITYEITYRDRGVHALGPTTVRVRDLLGLAERRFVIESADPVVVYPRCYRLSPAVTDRLRSLSASSAAERGAFAHLREYVRGDSLRDVHWKASAKRDDLVVQEFADDSGRETVTVVARADPGHADAMAEAAASVGVALLDAGVGVTLTTPDGGVDARPGDADRLLAHLARADGGRADDAADVVVDATGDGVTIRVDGDPSPFDPGRRVHTGGEVAA